MRALRHTGKNIGQMRRDDVGIVPYESQFVGDKLRVMRACGA